MDTLQLNYFGKKICKSFKGTYSANEIYGLEGMFIVNTDEMGQSGKHWCFMNIQKDQPCEYYDPAGFPVEYFHDYWRNYLLSHSRSYIHYPYRSQPIESNSCGEFCLYVMYLRCENCTLSDIVAQFDKQLLVKNERKVLSFLSDLVKMK